MTGYRHHGVGVLRASAGAVVPTHWPTLSDEAGCREWLVEVWPQVAEAVEHASPALATRVKAILSDEPTSGRTTRRATLAVVRYVQRFARSTPFGLFAGVAAATVGESATARFGHENRPHIRVDSRWLRQVVDRLEACSGLLVQLMVVYNNATERRGERHVLPIAEAVSVRSTAAVEAACESASVPVGVGALVDRLRERFPDAGDPSDMLATLVTKGFLLSSLRAPSTVVDPLGFVVDHLRTLKTDDLPVAALVQDLIEIHQMITAHNDDPSESTCARILTRLRAVVPGSARVPLSVDLRLDAQVQIPHEVAREMARAADLSARLVRQHTGNRPWRDWFAEFCNRYGTDTLVPLRLVVDPVAGLGFPRGYPGAAEPSGRHVFSERDRLLFALAADATTSGAREIELTNPLVDRLAAADGEPDAVPPHIDLGARVHATSRAAIERGEYTFTVAAGRAAGTLSSRFTPLVPELAEVFSQLPTTTAGATPAQLSFTPMYPSAENVARVAGYLTSVVSTGEHTHGAIGVDDLAVTASGRRLHLVQLSRRRIVEPMVLHALALKQQPALARFVGEVPRALDSGWVGFDWGAAEVLPFRPRIRSGRAILCAARWRLSHTDLGDDPVARDHALAVWRTRWRCPTHVELQDFDQQLPLDLDVAVHREILFKHLRANDAAVLVEAPEPDADGWCGGRAHTVVLPLTSSTPRVPAPHVASFPELGPDHGHAPGSQDATWLYAKVYVAESRMNAFLTDDMATLLADLGDRACWFVRWPQVQEAGDADHLRLRVQVDNDADKAHAVLSGWADRLRAAGRLAQVAFDTYYPETGRYLAIAEAENVFVADSAFVIARLSEGRDSDYSGPVGTASSLFDITTAFLGSREQAAAWFAVRQPSGSPARSDTEQATQLARGHISETPDLAAARRRLLATVSCYRTALPEGADVNAVLQSLLHMHHNRAVGVDREHEAVCLRLARQIAATWRACRTEAS